MKLTINGALALEKTLKSRMSGLKGLRDEVSVAETNYVYGDTTRETKKEPKYDVKLVDKKIVGLENALFKLSNAIKTANAKTEIGMEVDVDSLLSPLE